jgi:hypothetical protein
VLRPLLQRAASSHGAHPKSLPRSLVQRIDSSAVVHRRHPQSVASIHPAQGARAPHGSSKGKPHLAAEQPREQRSGARDGARDGAAKTRGA